MKREVNDDLFDWNSSLITLAHELKSPLVLIRQLTLSLDDASQKDTELIARQLSLTTDRTLRLVTDLTRVSRLEDAMFEMQPLSPRKICEDVIFTITSRHSSNVPTLTTSYTKKPTLIIAHPDLLTSVIHNFCENALHYSGGQKSPSRLFIKPTRQNQIRIGVRDFGPCLPLDIWRDIKSHKILTRPQSISARPQSSGLGLYITSRFVHAMHGRLGCVRHRDGTTIYADFPLSTQLSFQL
ncbi:HAMP domain-containing histidine kinase [Candidatus Saccharibacteria bacterium]|nr:HAMP domain-containing histidine kinase [Candidatus Saccharibacteria bacterium]